MTYADSSTNTKADRNGEKRKKMNKSCFMCHLSHVICHVSHSACHLSLTLTARDPPCANSHIMHPRLVCKDQKPVKKNFNTPKYQWNKKNAKNIKRYANISNTFFDQKSPVYREAAFLQWHKHKVDGHCNLETELSQRVHSVKIMD